MALLLGVPSDIWLEYLTLQIPDCGPHVPILLKKILASPTPLKQDSALHETTVIKNFY